MLPIKQTGDGVAVKTEGNFPDLVCDLAILYKIVEMRGAALGICVPRLIDLMQGDAYVELLAQRAVE